MDFFQNLNVRTKLVSGVSLILLVFLILIFWQFGKIDSIKKKATVLDKAEKSLNAVFELKALNDIELGLLLELIQTEELEEQKSIYEEHMLSVKKMNTLFDSLFLNIKTIFPKKSDIGRIKIVNNLDDSRGIFNDNLVEFFDNVNSIKKSQLEVGDSFLPEQLEDIDTTQTVSDTTETETETEDIGIFVVEESVVSGSTKSIQLIKLYREYKPKYQQAAGNFNVIIRILRSEFGNAEKAIQTNSTKIIAYNSVYFLIALIASFLFIIIINRTISKPLSELEKLALQLSEGELPEHSAVRSNDEIGKMAGALNKLTDGLMKTSEFASEIGRGNFKSAFEPLSRKDVLGNSLLEMRKSLQAANEEENKRKVEDQERNWTTEGLALFGEILRKHTENISELSRFIIQNLVKYLKANQGGIFILNDSDPENVYLELMSAYAYNREKFIEKRIQLGEGLVGGAAVEKYTIYMTDLPEEYIEIESGLGGANPKSLLIVPLKLEDDVLGVLEIASFNKLKKYEITLVERIAESIASTLTTAKINTQTTELLEQSRVQTQEMQEQEEEMRQNMEEIVAAQEDALRREETLKKEVSDLENIRINFVEKDKKQRSRIEDLSSKNNKLSTGLDQMTNQFNRVFESNVEPIVLIDEDKTIQFFNTAAEEMLGFNRTEVLGQGLNTIMFEENVKELEESISLYFQTARKGLIDQKRTLDLKNKLEEPVAGDLVMMDVIIKNRRGIALLIKNLSTVKQLENERTRILDELTSKEFDYSTKINLLETFIHANGLQIPDNLEAQSDLLTWSNKYSINLNIIDQQHKKWIDFINVLYRAYKKGSNKKEISEHISKLLDYSDYHFGFEEKYLEDFNCGNIENHKNEHTAFIKKLKNFQSWHQKGDADSVYRLIIFLNNWILKHIQEDDQRYVECFKLNGLS